MKHALLSLLFIGLVSSTLVCCGPPQDEERISNTIIVSAGNTVMTYDFNHPIPFPEYRYSPDLVGITVWVDENNIVQNTIGHAELMVLPNAQPGEKYVVLDSMPGYTYAEINDAYNQANYIYELGGMAENPWVFGDYLNLMGQDLTNSIQRYLIIAHEENGERSYQVIQLVFRRQE